MRPNLFILIFAVLISTSCSTPQYAYLPVEQKNAQIRDHKEAFYSIPPVSPQGNLRIQSGGVVDLKPKNGNERTPALHIRMTVSNQSQNMWVIKAQDQAVVYPNEGQAGPIFANSNSMSLPILEVRPGELRTMDLFFPLPTQEKSAKTIPQFDFRWHVMAGNVTFNDTTSFDRLTLPEPVASYPYYYGPYPYYGPYYYGPYPYSTFSLGFGSYWWGSPGWGYGYPERIRR